MSEDSSYSPNHPWILWGFSLINLLAGVINLRLALDQALHAGRIPRAGCVVSATAAGRDRAGVGRCTFVVFGIGLIRRRQWARRWILILVSNYAAVSVLWLVVYAESDYSRGRIVVQAMIAAGLVGLAAWIVRGRRIQLGVSGRRRLRLKNSGEWTA